LASRRAWSGQLRFCSTNAAPGGKTEGSEAAAATNSEAEDAVEIPPEVSELFDTLKTEALRRLDEFGPIHLFSLCWAYSTARLLDQDLQDSITNAALKLGQDRDANPNAGQFGKRSQRPRQLPTTEGEAPPPTDQSGEGSRSVQQDWKWYESPSILAEGKHWLALYKPPHWQVNVDSKEAAKEAERAAAAAPFEDDDEDDDAEGPQVQEKDKNKLKLPLWVRDELAPKYEICRDPMEAFGLMHRLDAQTSGVLLCAKSYVGAYWIRLQWCAYAVDKEYVALVHGWVPPETREIHGRIRVDKKKAPNSRRTISTICSVAPNGKPSFTEVYTLSHLERAVENGEPEKYSLVVLKLHTGRTHQIRVHMQSIGHPLVCDSKYGQEMYAADQTWCERNFLHTYHLGFNDTPDEPAVSAQPGKPVDMLCPLPKDLRQALSTLKPIDDKSAQPYEDWMSGEVSRLKLFEEYLPEEKEDAKKESSS